jgi:hypothetical protein
MIGAEMVLLPFVFARVLYASRIDRHPADWVALLFSRIIRSDCGLVFDVVAVFHLHGMYLLRVSVDMTYSCDNAAQQVPLAAVVPATTQVESNLCANRLDIILLLQSRRVSRLSVST